MAVERVSPNQQTKASKELGGHQSSGLVHRPFIIQIKQTFHTCTLVDFIHTNTSTSTDLEHSIRFAV